MNALTLPIETESSKLVIKIEPFILGNLLDRQDIDLMRNTEICDVSLVRESEYIGVDMRALHIISHMLFDFIDRNPGNIIYFYCDDFNEIPRSKNHRSLSPQEYRSRLFSMLFDHEARQHSADGFIDDILSFTFDGKTRFIHLIYGTGNSEKAELLKDRFETLKSK